MKIQRSNCVEGRNEFVEKFVVYLGNKCNFPTRGVSCSYQCILYLCLLDCSEDSKIPTKEVYIEFIKQRTTTKQKMTFS